MDTRKKLVTGGAWQVNCNRKQISTGGPRSFAQADLSVHTNKGSFALIVPADAIIGAQSASAINQSIDQLRQQIKVPNKLDCRVATAETSVMRFPTIVALVPTEAQKSGYRLVSGGCDLFGPEPGQVAGRAHNGPIIASYPNDTRTGWYCRAMDPPGIPLEYRVRAWAVYCANLVQ